VDGDNDAVAGAVASAVEATRSNKEIKKVLFFINGGGVGGAAWVDGILKKAEPEHVQVIPDLNPFNMYVPCGQKGSLTPGLTCAENMSASGAGIEDLHFAITKEFKIVDGNKVPLEGEDIERKYLAGDELATRLIDNAAILTATEILGLDKATHPQGKIYKGLDSKSTAIVCHGGFFRYKGVRERVERILKEVTGTEPTILYSDDFTKESTGNACAVGAAILALSAVGN
jgi:predicted NBD/HSP70 family sugar kinase